MPTTCRLSVQTSFYILEVIGDLNRTLQSDPVSISSTSHLQVNNLPRNSFYKFRIISNNSIGEGSSALLNFCELKFIYEHVLTDESERCQRILHELGHHTISALCIKNLNKYLALSKKATSLN